MSEPNLKAMTQAELFKYLEEDFMPRLLPKLANVQNLESENARLKAVVERLRKAGDAICAAYELGDDFLPPIQAWNAAKEGKQP